MTKRAAAVLFAICFSTTGCALTRSAGIAAAPSNNWTRTPSAAAAGSGVAWMELRSKGQSAGRAWANIKKTVRDELLFDILVEDKDYFITNWRRVRPSDVVSGTALRLAGQTGAMARLVCLKDGSSPFSALMRIEARLGPVAIDGGESRLGKRVRLAMDTSLLEGSSWKPANRWRGKPRRDERKRTPKRKLRP